MNTTVIPLTKFNIDWNSLLKVASSGLGKKITESLDNRGAKIGNLGSFVEILGAMRDVYNLNNPGPILRHIHYSFMVISDYRYYNEDLQIDAYTAEAVNGMYITILSGTLDKWQTAIINGCSGLEDYRTRFILNQCLREFDSQGLSKLWMEYRRMGMGDNTIKLIEKQ